MRRRMGFLSAHRRRINKRAMDALLGESVDKESRLLLAASSLVDKTWEHPWEIQIYRSCFNITDTTNCQGNLFLFFQRPGTISLGNERRYPKF